MKKLLLSTAFVIGSFLQAQNFEISTLRIGDLKIFMTKTEAEKLTNKPLLIFDHYDKTNKISLNGEPVEVILTDQYMGENQEPVKKIYVIKTKSPKFRTKSGLGIGSTKTQLLEAYKNYPNFEVAQYKDPDKPGKVQNFFTLLDNDAGTYLVFNLESDIVTEITVSINEGC